MSVLARCILILCLSAICTGLLIQAQETVPRRSMEIEAESIRKTSAEDDSALYEFLNSTVYDGKNKISADTIQYSTKTEEIQAAGNSVFEGPLGCIEGKNIGYSQKTGLVNGESVAYLDPVKKYYINADKVKIITAEKPYLELEGASLTNCNPKDPHWQIRFAYLKYFPNDYAYGYHAVLYMHGIPTLYTPVFGGPTVTERASGFLIPEISRSVSGNKSKSLGFRLKIPYFLNLRRDHDLTITPDFIQQRGVGLGLEYNYAFYEGMLGQISGWGIDEIAANRRPQDENMMADGDNPNPGRYALRYRHKQYAWLGKDKIFLEYRKNSDNEVNIEYFESSTVLDSSEFKDLIYIIPWRRGYFQAEYYKNEAFANQSIYNKDTDFRTTLSKEPELTLSHTFFDFPADTVDVSIRDKLSAFKRAEGWKGRRNIIQPEIMYNQLFGLLNINLTGGGSIYTYNIAYTYPESSTDISPDTEKTRNFDRIIPHSKGTASIEFFRPFTDGGGNLFGEFTIIPSISYDYVGDTEQRRSLSASPETVMRKTNQDYLDHQEMFDGYDRVYGYFSNTYRLDFTYYQIRQNRKRKIWGWSIYSIYDLWRKNNESETEAFFSGPYIEEIYRENKYGDMQLPLRTEWFISPAETYTVSGYMRYDHVLGRVMENNAGIDMTGKSGSRFGINYTHNSKAYKELNNSLHGKQRVLSFDTKFGFAKYWYFSYKAEWDLQRRYDPKVAGRSQREAVYSSVRLDKNDPCYNFFVSYEERIKEKTINAGIFFFVPNLSNAYISANNRIAGSDISPDTSTDISADSTADTIPVNIRGLSPEWLETLNCQGALGIPLMEFKDSTERIHSVYQDSAEGFPYRNARLISGCRLHNISVQGQFTTLNISFGADFKYKDTIYNRLKYNGFGLSVGYSYEFTEVFLVSAGIAVHRAEYVFYSGTHSLTDDTKEYTFPLMLEIRANLWGDIFMSIDRLQNTHASHIGRSQTGINFGVYF
ncbi:hypothetical protein CHS0354_027399 [Potamilus streckersoni]|uniref:LPS-assembly protein LptD n=1 Tax=Potamilus streckersoni TaxID=2493646 RepID=A0AAE0W013_9BIVA|nr:hypothetical protein CHS0354_027399 [Potamilus streckersoni]